MRVRPAGGGGRQGFIRSATRIDIHPMNLVFDGPAYPLGLVLPSLIALAPLGYWAYARYVRKRGASPWLLLIAALIFFGSNGIVLWDQLRVREMVRSGQGLHVTRGTITQSWHIVTRHRDWTRSSLSYTTVVSEGFDVAGMRFRWNIGDSYSPATFSNSRQPRLTFPEGAPVEVTWFADPADNNAARIVRLRVGAVTGQAAVAGAGITAVAARFAQALAAGDKTALAAMTHFPVNFAGHAVGQDRADTLWTALAMPALQGCLSAATPEPGSDGTRRYACLGVTLTFRDAGGGTWLLSAVDQAQ